MTPLIQNQLELAIRSGQPLEEIANLLRNYKKQGVGQQEVYKFLETLHLGTLDDALDDRILEVADFVAGFCAPHMRVWDETLTSHR